MMMMMMMMMHLSNHLVKKNLSVDKIIQLKEELKNKLKQNHIDEVTDEDLSKKLDLKPINKKFESSPPVKKQLTFTSVEDEE
jgi:hypothetical protein